MARHPVATGRSWPGALTVLLVLATGVTTAASPAQGIAIGASSSVAGTGRASGVATPSEVSAFVGRAERAFAGQLLVTYRVAWTTGPKPARGTVVAAQLPGRRWAYLSTPSTFDIRAQGSSSAVFVDPGNGPAGLYSCGRLSATTQWECGNDSQAMMGTRAALLGPYPPQALTAGLQNAIADYSGQPTGEHVKAQPAHLVARRKVGARALSCLAFGALTAPVAQVCLGSSGLITTYDIPIAGDSYATAELLSSSRVVPSRFLALPVKPTAAR